MALTHETAVRNGLADYVVDQLDSGNLVIMTTAEGTEVATLPLAATAFGAASSGTATAGTITDDSSATGGTAATFKMETSGNARIFGGSVGTSGADLNLSSLSISAGDTVSVTSFNEILSHKHPSFANFSRWRFN